MSAPIERPRAALLLIDFQFDFLSPQGRLPVHAHQARAMLMAANRLIEAAPRLGYEVAYVGNEFEPRDFPANWFRRNAAIRGTPGAALDPALRRVPGAPYFAKQRGDAFSNIGLEGFLDSHAVGRLIVAGAHADACVLRTAMSALRRGYRVVIPEDAVAAASESRRERALVRLRRAGARVTPADEFIADGQAEDGAEAMLSVG
ncbi:MAG TPA: cysteine hydrolase [Tepidisphaeraceae bacterium]|jgi:nicotinamidase-related amidase|nr:cysteine hydrolase [Tepidisphaeraceae bacterium]